MDVAKKLPEQIEEGKVLFNGIILSGGVQWEPLEKD